MSKKRTAAAAALLVLLVSSCARVAAPGMSPRLAAPDGGWVARTLKRMTIEEKVGQMVACRFVGSFRNADSAYLRELDDLVVKSGIGGLILFGGEVYETAELANAFQKLAKVPLLLASDFERGTGNQVTGATLFPPLMSLGAAGSEDLAYGMGRVTALEGRAMGIHMTYAPVVDVNINPDNPIINTRAVGADPGLVSRIANAFIRGAQDNGMIATAKHFPGHGDTSQDSHSLLPTIEAGLERLEKVELVPFKAAVDAGVRAVMTAHLAVPALDPTPGLPATLSAPILTGVLRNKLGFRGLIVTDALEMSGVTNSFSTEEASLLAVLAGVDQLLLPPDPAKVIAYLAGPEREAAREAGRRVGAPHPRSQGRPRPPAEPFRPDRRARPQDRLAGLPRAGPEDVRELDDPGEKRTGGAPARRRGRQALRLLAEQRPRRLLRRPGVRDGDEEEVPGSGRLLRRRRYGTRSPGRRFHRRLGSRHGRLRPLLQGQRGEGERRPRA
jgi:beta-glucosidase-like glycosyl hydrolase